jgi:hypothetical protein
MDRGKDGGGGGRHRERDREGIKGEDREIESARIRVRD